MTLLSQAAPLKLGRATQITNDGWVKDYGVASGTPIGFVTDGIRLYFNEYVGDKLVIAEVSTSGGESGVVPTTLFPQIVDISPRGSELLIKESAAATEGPLWILPLPMGAPRRLGNVSADTASWLPDGQHIAYIKAPSDLYLVNADGTSNYKLLSKGQMQSVVSSPDGQRLRLDVWDPEKQSTTIWEAKADGSGLHPPLPEDWNKDAQRCCGHWTPDGKYFVFVTLDDRRSDLWALPECRRPLLGCKPQPVQLTNGPLSYEDLVPSRDGKQIFAFGKQKRAELVRFDPRSGQYVPFLSGISAAHVAFSRDGQWVTWVNYPENTLWCSKADGSDRRQLTYPPLTVLHPRWSGDGKRIAFTTHEPGRPWRIYTVSRDGGTPEPRFVEEHRQLLAAWGPDDNFMVIGRPNRENPMAIELLDLKTGKATELPGSQDLWLPAWSPDGKYILAVSRDSLRLMLFDFGTGKWKQLAEGLTSPPSFSPDSKFAYYEDYSATAIYRVSVSGGKPERVASFKDLRRPMMPHWGQWWGLAPNGSLLAMRDLGTQEIYAFDVLP